MNMIKSLAALFSITLLAATSAQAAYVVNPFAADLPSASYTTSSQYQSGMVESFFNGGYWNSGWWGTAWLQADMGVTRTLSEVRLLTDQMPYGVTNYAVYLSDTAIGNNYSSLIPVAIQNMFTYDETLVDLEFAPTAGRFLLILANGGPSWTALGGGERINWVDDTFVPGNGANLPEPSGLVLIGLGLLGLIASRRRIGIPA